MKLNIYLCVLITGISLHAQALCPGLESTFPAQPNKIMDCMKAAEVYLAREESKNCSYNSNTDTSPYQLGEQQVDIYHEKLQACFAKVAKQNSKELIENFQKEYLTKVEVLVPFSAPSPIKSIDYFSAYYVKNRRSSTVSSLYFFSKDKKGKIYNITSVSTGDIVSHLRFIGFDFAPYQVNSTDRLVSFIYATDSVTTGKLKKTSVQRNIVRNFILLTQTSEGEIKFQGSVLSDDSADLSLCTWEVRSAPDNSLANLIKNCPRSKTRTTFQWNGSLYSTEEPASFKESLKLAASIEPIKYKSTSKPQKWSDLEGELIERTGFTTKEAKVAFTSSPLIKKGLAKDVMKKINTALVIGDPVVAEPSPCGSDETPEFCYGSYSDIKKIRTVTANTVTVETNSVQCPPSSRCYDSISLTTFSRLTGDVIDFSKPPLGQITYFALSQIKGRTYYKYPEMYLFYEPQEVPEQDNSPLLGGGETVTLMPEGNGLDVLNYSHGGGHSYEVKIGRLLYKDIPGSLIKPGSILDLEAKSQGISFSNVKPTSPLLNPKNCPSLISEDLAGETLCKPENRDLYQKYLRQGQILLENNRSLLESLNEIQGRLESAVVGCGSSPQKNCVTVAIQDAIQSLDKVTAISP